MLNEHSKIKKKYTDEKEASSAVVDPVLSDLFFLSNNVGKQWRDGYVWR
jgi:hypothetical protein